MNSSDDSARRAQAPVSQHVANKVRAALTHLHAAHALDYARLADLLEEPLPTVMACALGEMIPTTGFQKKVKSLTLRMDYASRVAWQQRIAAAGRSELLLDRELMIIAVDGMEMPGAPRPTKSYSIPRRFFLGRKYNDLLPTLDCTLIETHGNGIDDLKTIGFFDGKIASVRFCFEVHAGDVVVVAAIEIWPIVTVDDGILAHVVVNDLPHLPRVLKKPGVHVHWRNVRLAPGKPH